MRKLSCLIAVAIALTAVSFAGVQESHAASISSGSSMTTQCGCNHCVSQHGGMYCAGHHSSTGAPWVPVTPTCGPGGCNAPPVTTTGNPTVVPTIDLQGTWYTSPGDEQWQIYNPRQDGMGNIVYDFQYQGQIVSGTGTLTYNPMTRQISGTTTNVGSDFLGAAIPLNSMASGYVSDFNHFTMNGWRLDNRIQSLMFRR